MISMARTLGAPDRVPAGRVARSTSIGPEPGAQPARHLGGQVHDVAVALDGHQLVDRLGAELDHPPHVVAGQVDQHDVLGQLLGVLDQLAGQQAVLLLGGAPRPGAGDGPGGHHAVAQADHGLGRRPDHGHLVEAQEVEVRARVEEAQGAVDVEGVGPELEVEALGQHDLEDVPGHDVLLGRRHGVHVGLRVHGAGPLGRRRSRPGAGHRAAGRGPVAVGGQLGQPAGRPRRRRPRSRSGRHPGRPPRCRPPPAAGASGRTPPAGRSPCRPASGNPRSSGGTSGRCSTSRTTS